MESKKSGEMIQIEIGTKFMYNGQEYEVIFKNIKDNRISIKPIGKVEKLLQMKERVLIENIYFKVSYIRKDRITLDLIE